MDRTLQKAIFGCLFLAAQSLALSAQTKPPCPDVFPEIKNEVELQHSVVIGRKDIYVRKNMGERDPLGYGHLEEKDVVWEKRVTRTIDVREKINNPFTYPLRPFVSILVDGVLDGEIPAYWPLDDELVHQMPIADLEQQLFKRDSFLMLDEYGEERVDCNGNPVIGIAISGFNPESVQQINIEEVWYFDEETGQRGVRIVSIAPLLPVTNKQTGEVIGSAVVFRLYYPEIRGLLAKNRAFNAASDVDVLSWEDIFEMRLFSSYIAKESNVFNQRIKDYQEELNALHEAENIHQTLFNREQNVWQD